MSGWMDRSATAPRDNDIGIELSHALKYFAACFIDQHSKNGTMQIKFII